MNFFLIIYFETFPSLLGVSVKKFREIFLMDNPSVLYVSVFLANSTISMLSVSRGHSGSNPPNLASPNTNCLNLPLILYLAPRQLVVTPVHSINVTDAGCSH